MSRLSITLNLLDILYSVRYGLNDQLNMIKELNYVNPAYYRTPARAFWALAIYARLQEVQSTIENLESHSIQLENSRSYSEVNA